MADRARCGGNEKSLRSGNAQGRKRSLRHHHVLLDLGPARRDRADHLAINRDREPAGHVGEVAHAHRHTQRVLLRGVASRLLLRRRGDGLALRSDDREMTRAVHHQEGDHPAALVDHRKADLAAERVGLGDAGGKHLEARFLGEPVGGDDVGHDELIHNSHCVVPAKAGTQYSRGRRIWHDGSPPSRG